MNKAQKELHKTTIEAEAEMVKELEKVYKVARSDCNNKIKQLQLQEKFSQDNIHTIIYQKNYQNIIMQQLNEALKELESGQYKTIKSYVENCYKNGYIGVLYDLMFQGIPITLPMDQGQVIEAMQIESQLSEKYYAKEDPDEGDELDVFKKRAAEDVDKLKKSIRGELSRSIALGESWDEAAMKIAFGMNSSFTVAYKNALRIARTEGHRVQQKATHNAQVEAKAAGADVVKQWDATLDDMTRPHHQELDGQIREIDEPFEVAGMKAMYPGGFRVAAEDINCRCVIMQRAVWALDEDELQALKDRAEYFGFVDGEGNITSQSFNDFKEKYSNKVELTEAEHKAVLDYMSSISYIINEKARRDIPLTSDEMEITINLDTALEKFPQHKGELTRSLYFTKEIDVENFLKSYEVGCTIKYKEYISTTKGDEYNPDGQVQIRLKNTKSGYDISSMNRKETEVLFKRGSEFIVKGIIKKSGKVYIDMEEK